MTERDYTKELEAIEKEMVALKTKREKILREEKEKKESKKAERYKEVESAYNKFIDLLDAYETDFNEGFSVKISGEFY